MPKPKPSSAPVKNALARALDAWMESEEGRSCLRADNLGGSRLDFYLANRLKATFCAGWDAAKAEAAEETVR